MLNKRTIPGICETCGKAFIGFHPPVRFCSRSCVRTLRPIEIAFWVHVSRPVEGCWLSSTLASDGYARFRRRPAHQVAWELASGQPVPDGLIVLHTCDVRNCVRNDGEGVYVVGGRTLPRFGHLALGTSKDNAIDASEKGISAAGAYRRAALKPESYQRGEQHHRAVLSQTQADEIRRRYAGGGIFQRNLAVEYGVSKLTIKMVLSGSTYKDSVDSLRIAAPSENLHQWGEHVGNAALTNAQAEEIRRLKTEGRTQKSLAQQFGVSQSTISNVLLGLRYQQSTRQ